MNYKKHLIHLGFTALALAGMWQCSTATAGSLFISAEDELELGQQFDAELREKEKFLSASEPISKYLDSLGRQIVAKISDEDWEHLLPEGSNKKDFFTFTVIESETENAFAVPGGYTYFYTGILKNMKTEAELIGVLGHEIGHVVMHHSRDRIIKAGAVTTVLSILTGGSDESLLGALGANWYLNNNGQEDELESDSIGVHLSDDLGISPEGIKVYFSKGLEFDADGNCDSDNNALIDIIESMSTHPPSCDRVNQVKDFCTKGKIDCSETKGTSESEYKTKVLNKL